MSGMAGDIQFLLWLLLLSNSSSCFGSELDIQCLKTIQQSVIDPKGILKSSWIFDNGTEGFICQFTGVECWHPGENMVFSLDLDSLGLEGQFPQGLENCTSMRVLDLSTNNFSGPIPSDIARKVPDLASLDLSYNSFSSEIPVGISNMVHLNILNLQHNQLSGQIPGQFNVFTQLTQLIVAYNQLSGRIPSALQMFPPSYFAGNQGLCGAPLDDCPRKRKWRRIRVRLPRINDESSIGAAAGFVAGFVVAFYFPHWFIFSRSLHPYIFRIC
ncbi:probably inactive leucine-rich repeat receptor-like protein kinase At5g48380 [Phragmites australis]|uniref:probably inactive leucine-rich repeat receptor-like protein kinase At5g48380 n=1 Tax=Phragmites australis TaxID=29695 RepID=UPI002D795034|nr:probably inactive leucine-rich repeat receptor-like protein kinase At5g48380 [Phragmites australis]